MKVFTFCLVLLATFATLPTSVFAHGGGCRKSSPPGQCCHADKKNNGGKVHCH